MVEKTQIEVDLLKTVNAYRLFPPAVLSEINNGKGKLDGVPTRITEPLYSTSQSEPIDVLHRIVGWDKISWECSYP